jgi:hypothetical protein
VKGVPKHQKVLLAISSFVMSVYDSNNRGVVDTSLYIDGLQNHSFSLGTSNKTPPLPVEKHMPQKVPVHKKKTAGHREGSHSQPI